MRRSSSLLLVFLFVLVVSVCGRGAVRIVSAEEIGIVDGPEDLCNYYASTTDLENAGIVTAISDECAALFGKTPNSVEVNDDTYPYKMCIVATNASFGDLTPVDAQSVVALDSFNNTTNQNVSHTFSLSGDYQDSLQISTTNTVSFSVSVDYNINIPTIFSMKFDFNASYSSSKTTTQSSSMQETYTSSTTLTCLPQCDYTASLNVQSLIYKATVSIPICLSGYAKCAYSERVNGHYWWYVLIDDFIPSAERCAVQSGLLASAVSVNSQTSLAKSCY